MEQPGQLHKQVRPGGAPPPLPPPIAAAFESVCNRSSVHVACCRPPVPVPRVFKEGVSEAQARAVAEKAAKLANTGLGECVGAWVGGWVGT